MRARERHVTVETEPFARQPEQQIVPADRGTTSHALEQDRIAIRKSRMQLEKCVFVELEAPGCRLV